MKNGDLDRGMAIQNEEWRSGTRKGDPERGMKHPMTCVNSVMICGERGPAMCAKGGTSDPLFRCINRY